MWRPVRDAGPGCGDRRQGGFTLREILVVAVPVALLSLPAPRVPVWVDDPRQLDSQSASLADPPTTRNEQTLFSGRYIALRVTDTRQRRSGASTL